MLNFREVVEGRLIEAESSDGHYMAAITDGKLNHIRSGATAYELRQIADNLDELNGKTK